MHFPLKSSHVMEFWILHIGFRIPGAGFQFLSVEPDSLAGFQIPWAVFHIPKPSIPDFPRFRNPDQFLEVI